MLEVKWSASKVVIIRSVMTVALVTASAVDRPEVQGHYLLTLLERAASKGFAVQLYEEWIIQELASRGLFGEHVLEEMTPAMCVPLQVIVMVCVWRHGDGLDWMLNLRVTRL